MNERQEQIIYDEGRRRGFNDGYFACRDELAEKMMERIEDDGTLVVGVKDATKVTRVLVEDDKKNGDLYYVMSDDTFEWCHDCKEYDQENYCCHRWTKVIRNTVAELMADRPRGEWAIYFDKVENGMGGTYRERRWYCSACGKWQTYGETDFCPNCGADMRGANDETD